MELYFYVAVLVYLYKICYAAAYVIDLGSRYVNSGITRTITAIVLYRLLETY